MKIEYFKLIRNIIILLFLYGLGTIGSIQHAINIQTYNGHYDFHIENNYWIICLIIGFVVWLMIDLCYNKFNNSIWKYLWIYISLLILCGLNDVIGIGINIIGLVIGFIYFGSSVLLLLLAILGKNGYWLIKSNNLQFKAIILFSFNTLCFLGNIFIEWIFYGIPKNNFINYYFTDIF